MMKNKEHFYTILISWDFWLAIIFTILYIIYTPNEIVPTIAKDLFSVAVSVLSIIFSIFFAALAVIMTAGDNDFVKFLLEGNEFTNIIWNYKFTLTILFVALVSSILLFVSTLFIIDEETSHIYPLFIMAPYVFLSTYSLLCTINSTLDSIKYVEFRNKFAKVQSLHKSNEAKISKRWTKTHFNKNNLKNGK